VDGGAVDGGAALTSRRSQRPEFLQEETEGAEGENARRGENRDEGLEGVGE